MNAWPRHKLPIGIRFTFHKRREYGCRHDRLAALTAEERAKLPPLCPDFVIELRSPTDSLSALQDKMREYMENGAQLGWLIDPLEEQVFVYRPGVPVERLEGPDSVSADPLLPGFRLELDEILQTPDSTP